jgi:hypothetical protein
VFFSFVFFISEIDSGDILVKTKEDQMWDVRITL